MKIRILLISLVLLVFNTTNAKDFVWFNGKEAVSYSASHFSKPVVNVGEWDEVFQLWLQKCLKHSEQD